MNEQKSTTDVRMIAADVVDQQATLCDERRKGSNERLSALVEAVARDVSHLRDDVAKLDASIQAHIRDAVTKDDAADLRFRKLEATQIKHATRWRFFGWSVALLAALSGIIGLIQLLT